MTHAPSTPQPDDAFVQALTECQVALRGYCEAALGHGEDAKDAWQHTNVALWRKAADWQPGTRFISWALAVARFEVLAVIRDRQRERLLFDSDVAELMADEAAHHAEGLSARREALAVCMDKLPPKQREVLTAHYLADHAQADIAKAQGMGLSAVKVLLLRVRRALAECIERQLQKEAIV